MGDIPAPGQTFQQREIHAADERREAFGDGVEGAVAHTHDRLGCSGRLLGACGVPAARGAFQMRFVAAGRQHRHGLFEAAAGRRQAAQGLA
ncbi:hypothetical protein, partial [Streptomyces sp. NPDC003998]